MVSRKGVLCTGYIFFKLKKKKNDLLPEKETFFFFNECSRLWMRGDIFQA